MTYALRDAAVAIRETRSPAILLAWRGAHTWVMTGYRADADPRFFRNSRIDGAYILDPWYPRISSIWGPSNPPGTFTTFAELQDNFLPWKRPEGNYPDRDGLCITVVPTEPRPAPPQPSRPPSCSTRPPACARSSARAARGTPAGARP